MKNARRILSLVLSFLMVFGSVATLLPTTVMAEDEGISITFQDANGVQIGNPVPLENATTIKELLESGAAANVKAAITQTADKVFAGWTLADGVTAVDDTAAVTENLTVKATFSNYKVYTAEDLAAEKVAGRLEKGRLFIYDTTTTYNVDNVSRTFLRITPDETSSYYKRAHKFAWSLGHGLSGYSVMAINHITNARHNDLAKSSYISATGGSITGNKYYVNPDTTIIADETTGYATGTEEILATYPVSDGATKFEIIPWGAADFRYPTNASSGGTHPEDYTKTYLDIEYIAFFEKAGAENHFDYAAYLNPVKNVTFLDESGALIAVVSVSESTSINALLKTDADGVAEVNSAIALTADKTFAGWASTNGTTIDANAAINGNVTVRATLSNYKVYTAEDLAAENTAGRIDDSNRTIVSSETRTENGRTFLRITPDEASSYYKRAQKFAWSLGYELTGYSVMAINHITNARHNDLSKSSYITPSNGSTTYYVNPSTDLEDKGGYTDGTEEILATYPITDGAKKFEIVPWGAADFRSPADAAKGGIAPEDYTKTYVDIEYIAFFEKAGAENHFDYKAYLNPTRYVTFIGEDDTELAVVQIDEENNTIKKILDSDADGVDTVKSVIAQTKTRVFAGWKLDDGTVVDANAEITKDIKVKATFSSYEIYTWSELLEERKAKRLTIGAAGALDLENDFKFRPTARNVRIEWKNAFDLSLNDYEVFVVNYLTNASSYTDHQESFATVYAQDGSEVTTGGYTNASGGTANYIPYATTSTKVNAAGTGVDDITAVFPLYYVKSSEKVTGISGFKFAPLKAVELKYPATAEGKGDYDNAWFDILYFALFEKEGAVEYFDYTTYISLKDTARFKNTEGAIVDDLTQEATDGKITLPDYNDADFLGWKIEGASDSTIYAAGDIIAISRPTVFVPFMKVPVNVTIIDDDGAKTVEAIVGLNLPLEGVLTQFKDSETGEYMVVSGVLAGDATEAVSVDTYVVSEDETELTLVYAPAYILSASDGTLEDGTSRHAEAVKAPVTIDENGVLFKRITAINGALTKDSSQVQFLLTEEGNGINKNAGKITYEKNPYVSYLYRTNINLSQSSNTIKAAYSVNQFSHNGDYSGTAKFGQVIENVEFDEKWQILVHKAESFGTITKDAVFAGYLDGVRVSPWSNEADITLDGTEYADIQYIGFFPSETAAKNFNYSKYLEQNALEVTVTIDGEVNTELSGNYMPGAVINFPDVIGEGLAGYVLADGTVAMSVTVPQDDDGDGKIEIAVTSREVNVDEYIQYRGNLNNLKNAGNDITVVYIGGSITDGRGASGKANRWTTLTTEYLKTRFTNVTEYEEALGGHGSRSAAYRLAGDVLSHNPDIVFIEFAINDTYNDDVVNGVYDGKYYEYVIREIRKQCPNTEIVSIYTSNWDVIRNGTKLIEGKHYVAKKQDEIAYAYDIPSVDVGKYAFEAIFGENGDYSENVWLNYYSDSVHPADSGYALYARAIREYLETALNEATSDASPETMLDEADVLYPKSLTFMPAVLGWDELEITGLVPADVKQSTTINKYYKYDPDYTGDRTVSFTFEGTELGIYIALPTDDENTEIGGAGNTSATGTVTVTIDGVKHTKAPGRKGPYMYGQNLENKKHEVTITISNVNNDSCKLYGIFVGQEKKTYTIDLSASAGGQVEYNGETEPSHTISAYEGQTLTFVAVPDSDSQFREWHDLTSGHIVVLKDEYGTPYGETLSYTVTGNAVLNANFIRQTSEAPVRLVAFLGRGNQGYITVGNSETKETYVSAYMNGSSATALKAVAYEGFTPAYWVRFTQDSLTQVLLETGDTVNAYPLGSSVYYQPVFAEAGKTKVLTVDKATREIISVEEIDGEVAVTVNYVDNSSDATSDKLLKVIGLNGTEVLSEKHPTYASEWIISTGNTNTKWMMQIRMPGETEFGDAFDISYEQTFNFNYMFQLNTEIVITEVALGEEEIKPDYVIETLASWTANGITNFSAAFDLAEGFELVQHGVMMSKNAADLKTLANNTTGIISVADGTIVGKINAANPTAFYTVSKRLANNDDVWYGRAYLIYKNGETTYLVYADDTVPVPEV